MALAAYDEIADWYAQYVDGEAGEFSQRVTRMLQTLLGKGSGICVDMGCGTGARANTIEALGYKVIGVDISAQQLKHAKHPRVVGDAAHLPFSKADAVTCILCHTDVPDYRAVVKEAARISTLFVHIGVHPAFTGAFADRTDPGRIVVDATYQQKHRRWDSFTPKGVRAKVGAWHTPIAELFNGFIEAGFTIARVEEGGPEGAVPDLLGVKAVKA